MYNDMENSFIIINISVIYEISCKNSGVRNVIVEKVFGRSTRYLLLGVVENYQNYVENYHLKHIY